MDVLDKQPKPVKKDQRLTVTIDNEGDKGDGIAKVTNFIIIIKKALAKKTYEVEITQVYATYAFARIIKEIKPKTSDEGANR